LAILIGCAIAIDRLTAIMNSPTVLTPARVHEVLFFATISVTSGYVAFAAACVVLLVARVLNSMALPACSNFARWIILVAASVFAATFVEIWFADVAALASGDWSGALTKSGIPGPDDCLFGILHKSQIAGVCIIAIGVAVIFVSRLWNGYPTTDEPQGSTGGGA
jgi:hypothetical protein